MRLNKYERVMVACIGVCFAVAGIAALANHLHVQSATQQAREAADWPRVKAEFVSYKSRPEKKTPSHQLVYQYKYNDRIFRTDYCDFYSADRCQLDYSVIIGLQSGSPEILAHVNPRTPDIAVLDVSDRRSDFEKSPRAWIFPVLLLATGAGFGFLAHLAPKAKARKFDYHQNP